MLRILSLFRCCNMKRMIIVCGVFLIAVVVLFSDAGGLAQTKSLGLLANPPSPKPVTGIARASMTASWGTNGNPSGTEYLCENITTMSNSGWITDTSWVCTGLASGSAYSFTVKARNDDGIETVAVNLGAKKTMSYIEINDSQPSDGDLISSRPAIKFRIDHSVALDTAQCGAVIDGTFYVHDSREEGSGYTVFTYTAKSSLSSGRHEIGAKAVDSDGSVYQDSIRNLQVKGDTPVLAGSPLCYPNPFDPSQGNAVIAYSLSMDCDISVYIIDDAGMVAVKKEYLSGSAGARSGYNEIEWDGSSVSGSNLRNGAYVAVVTASGTLLGKAKLMLLRSR